VFAGKEKIDVSYYIYLGLRHAGMNEERKGRDSLTACRLPVPDCSNYADLNGLRQQVKKQLALHISKQAILYATKPPQEWNRVDFHSPERGKGPSGTTCDASVQLAKAAGRLYDRGSAP
jgi:hypothetical protein